MALFRKYFAEANIGSEFMQLHNSHSATMQKSLPLSLSLCLCVRICVHVRVCYTTSVTSTETPV